jgi:zinc transport system substrate-binding protein
LQFLTQRIVGDAAVVEFPNQVAADPQNWNPSVADILSIQSADLVVVNGPGADYSPWMIRVSLPDSKICNCSDGLATKDFIRVKEHAIVHSHGPEGEHSHPFMVPFSWLDPAIAKKQARLIATHVSRVYPDKKQIFAANLNDLELALDELSGLLTEPVDHKKPVVLSSPNFLFLTRAAGINATYLLWFQAPSREQWDKEFQQSVGATSGGTMIWSERPPDFAVEEMEARQIQFLVIDLLDRKPLDGDFLTTTRKNIEQIKSID